jgi:hypothetical protein
VSNSSLPRRRHDHGLKGLEPESAVLSPRGRQPLSTNRPGSVQKMRPGIDPCAVQVPRGDVLIAAAQPFPGERKGPAEGTLGTHAVRHNSTPRPLPSRRSTFPVTQLAELDEAENSISSRAAIHANPSRRQSSSARCASCSQR